MDLKHILETARVIAVVGCSGRPSRTSFAISRYLIERGYTVLPVNPNYDEVHGLRCYPDLASLPEDAAVDIVNVFRNPRHASEVAKQAVEMARRTGTKPVLWTQVGVSTTAAREVAEEGDLPYVSSRCILVEHSRHF